MKPIVQISLDLVTIPEALETAHMAIRAGVDWLEAGTPLRPAGPSRYTVEPEEEPLLPEAPESNGRPAGAPTEELDPLVGAPLGAPRDWLPVLPRGSLW